MMKKTIAVIVDGYSGGNTFAARIKKRGIECVHIQSQGKPHKIYTATFCPADYIENIVYRGDLNEIIQKLEKYQVKCVIPGQELGVELADQLSERLGVLSNGTVLSEARRDKYKMIEAVRKHGLKTARQIISNDLEEIYRWVDDLGQWPVVLKPIKSCSTDLLAFCYSKSQVKKAFDRILNNPTYFGIKNEVVLAQSFLKGTEYIVNCVSFEGQHFLSDLWMYKKKYIKGAALVYDYVRLLPFEYEHQQVLFEYTKGVLDALGIQYGASHTEVMLTDSGPILVECAARIMGTINQDYIGEAIGSCPAELTIDAYLNPKKFLKEASKPYKLKHYLLIKLMISYVSGTVKSIEHLDEIRKLPSFREIHLKPSPGDIIKKTVDLITSPGLIVLFYDDEKIVLNDHRKIAQLEKTMFTTKV
ncbi:MAG: ATP-grasp domain-containing protein [Gammaproteobacteria bacterium]|nr:ATP-grasp domain-containing protein [Gammaproteobacteria bacterium]